MRIPTMITVKIDFHCIQSWPVLHPLTDHRRKCSWVGPWSVSKTSHGFPTKTVHVSVIYVYYEQETKSLVSIVKHSILLEVERKFLTVWLHCNLYTHTIKCCFSFYVITKIFHRVPLSMYPSIHEISILYTINFVSRVFFY